MGHKDYDAPELTKGKSFNDGCDICSIGLIMPFKLYSIILYAII